MCVCGKGVNTRSGPKNMCVCGKGVNTRSGPKSVCGKGVNTRSGPKSVCVCVERGVFSELTEKWEDSRTY